MCPRRADGDYLVDIQEAARRIASYTHGMTYDGFLEDLKSQDAVIRNLETIGEAAKNLSAEFRAAHNDMPWKGMAGVRDRLIHDCFGVNLDIVWHIVTSELPPVVASMDRMAPDGEGHR